MAMHMKNIRTRLVREDGTALVIALMAVMLLTALGAAVIMVTNTETRISGNYRNGQEALYAADAAVERVVQDLLMVPRWNDILAGSAQSSFVDGAANAEKALPGGGVMRLDTATTQLQADSDAGAVWGANNPRWRLFAWGPLHDMVPGTEIDSPMYMAVWIADDPADAPPDPAGNPGTVPDGNPLVDANGTLTLHAEAFGPGLTRKVIEVTVARTSSTEIERGQIAQRGQEELNQRARKAAVQTPGKQLNNMKMNLGSGNLIAQ
jgi:type IV pilus assembly PilX-like protein